MRIVLIYPPPWKIPDPDRISESDGDGPPRHWKTDDRFNGDEMTVPYGLLSLAAQAKRDGHAVTVLNLYSFAWQDIMRLLPFIKADLFGLSCFTANRRGSLSLARQIRRQFPEAHIVLGGPHAGALPIEILEHCEAVDSVVIGEGEATFMELIQRLQNLRGLEGLAGSAYRSLNRIRINEPRPRIDDLDALVSPYDYISSHIFLSSRGCPGQCTFCGSPTLWGPKVRFHSAEYSLNVLEKMARVYAKQYINMKDDTFTADRKRVLRICDGIIKRNLNFLWSCDTRVDYLDEEILSAMRRAGCQMVSLGIESGSPEILKTLNKRTSPEKALEATRMLKAFGFTIRFYMIAASRGETAETLDASMNFISEAKPNQYLFSFLTLCPGTKEFEIAVQSGKADTEMFFLRDDLYFLYQPDRPYEGRLKQQIEQINAHSGVQNFWEYSSAEREKILSLFPDSAAVHMDLGKAYYLEGAFEKARQSVQNSLKRSFPLPALGYNYLACLAARQSKIQEAIHYLEQARKWGHYRAVDENLKTLREWIQPEGPTPACQPDLLAYHEYEKNQSGTQPIVPAPITIRTESGVNSELVRLVPSQ